MLLLKSGEICVIEVHAMSLQKAGSSSRPCLGPTSRGELGSGSGGVPKRSLEENIAETLLLKTSD